MSMLKQNNKTALMFASENDHTEIVQALLDKGWMSMLKQRMDRQP